MLHGEGAEHFDFDARASCIVAEELIGVEFNTLDVVCPLKHFFTHNHLVMLFNIYLLKVIHYIK